MKAGRVCLFVEMCCNGQAEADEREEGGYRMNDESGGEGVAG